MKKNYLTDYHQNQKLTQLGKMFKKDQKPWLISEQFYNLNLASFFLFWKVFEKKKKKNVVFMNLQTIPMQINNVCEFTIHIHANLHANTYTHVNQ